MSLEITELAPAQESAYTEFLQSCPWAMIYHSLVYRKLLKAFLTEHAEDHYLLAYDAGKIVGAFPFFIIDGPFGPALNSLPFFGSHGSILLSPGATSTTAHKLVDAMMLVCKDRGVTFSTIIDTPFFSAEDYFRQAMGFQYKDERIGQLTFLPNRDTAEQVSDSLFSIYHQKTRNVVRKGLSSGLYFGHDPSSDTLDALHELHELNILGIGGIAKPKRFFNCISTQLQYDLDYRIYTARTDSGKIVCAMMLLYFKNTVEYFIPATAESWRSAQPLSALIHIAMQDAVLERATQIWNWGGTWLTQEGVYRFKSRWGTKDQRYSYYTRVNPAFNKLQNLSRDALLQGYPWFYTVPFSALSK